VRYLPDKKLSAASQTVATARIAPKICQGKPPANRHQCTQIRSLSFTFASVE